jgi:hypothetical protein
VTLGSRLWPLGPRLLVLLVLLLPVAGNAQRPGVVRRAAQRQAQRQLDDTATGRARLEQELRRNFARRVRQQVGLTDVQMRRLVPITQRFEVQRRQLLMQERAARLGLRDAVMSQPADSAQVERLLATLIDVQRRRVQILEAEQRDLAAFMSPVQRAKFMALQEQVRRQVEQMRQRRAP